MKTPVFVLAALALAGVTAGAVALILTGRGDQVAAGLESGLFGRDVSAIAPMPSAQYRRMEAAAQVLNQGLPRQLDSVTTADSIGFTETSLIYNYTLKPPADDGSLAQDEDALLQIARASVVTSACAQAGMLALMREGIDFVYRYRIHGTDRRPEFTIGIADCGGERAADE